MRNRGVLTNMCSLEACHHRGHTGTSDCEPCTLFQSQHGVLVRAFECEGSWNSLPHDPAHEADTTHLRLPIDSYGPGHASSFYPPAYGAPLLTMASVNASDVRVQQFRNCARRETSPVILRDGPWVGSAGPRPTSVLRAGSINVEYATYANSFGLVLRGSTRVVGAHAFDAWTTKRRPTCKDEDQHAALRFEVTQQFCNHVHPAMASYAISKGASSRQLHGRGMHTSKEGSKEGRKKGMSTGRSNVNIRNVGNKTLGRWPAHVALSRVLASSAANCLFKTVPSMLRQQERFRALLHQDAGLLERCPFARYAGAISQVASVYDVSDVSGIFVLDWIPSHLPLAQLAFERLSHQLNHKLQLVRFSRQRGGNDGGTANTQAPNRGDKITCSCHRLPWPDKSRPVQPSAESSGST